MARARNIKPGLFKNELLVEQPAFVRLLFVGLWTLADREGRIEDRPKKIKLELFPYDDDDIEESLSTLARLGFIHRYAVAGVSVINIVNFLKHQAPHGTEKDSELPNENGEFTVHQRDSKGCVLGITRRNNVKSAENNVPSALSNSEPSVIAPEDNVPSALDNALIPDLLNPSSLIPDSLIPDLAQQAAPDAPAKPARKSKKNQETSIPENFTVSDRVKNWAKEHGHSDNRVSENFAKFALWAKSKGKTYSDWDSALMGAIRDNWAKTAESAQSAATHSTDIAYKEYRPK